MMVVTAQQTRLPSASFCLRERFCRLAVRLSVPWDVAYPSPPCARGERTALAADGLWQWLYCCARDSGARHGSERRARGRQARRRGAIAAAPVPPTRSGVNRPADEPETPAAGPLRLPGTERDVWKTVETVALFGLISLAPMGLLMVTAFVRINIVLILLRQALGSPQVPGNQVLTALSLLLTALVMWPIGEKVYHDAIVPYKAKQLELAQAWTAGTQPIKVFMVDQIKKTNHEDYLHALHEYAVPPSPGQSIPARPAPRTFRSASWRRPTCSAS